jgi:NADH-quinone oxidoreductase subunit G/NADP-reducing hydrogenase subunit HndD
LGKILGVEETRFDGEHSDFLPDASVSVTRDMSKCILCRRCITVCNEVQGTGVLNVQNRGFETVISPGMEKDIGSVNCAFCGQCTVVCPVGALKETSSTDLVWSALHDPSKRVVVQVAPAIRVAIGEEFGMPAGTRCTGKLANALYYLGFDDIFDTNWAADLTIMEEGTEFLSRVKSVLTGDGGVLPMITSCSPGWIKYAEHAFPDKLSHLSTCKSPHMMLGAIVKSYYAEKLKLKPKDIFVVSVMPCTAKKFEIARPNMKISGIPNVDAVITTRELGDMIKEAGIDFLNLPDRDFDTPLGMSTGAADIFGLTGGVMEAALRTVYEIVTGRELPFENLHVTPIVGLESIKEATIAIRDPLPEYSFLDGFEVRIAVTSGLNGANALMEQIVAGNSPYHFIEIMGCPGGCITGGGQPRSTDPDVRIKRMNSLYDEDESKTIRKSHENPHVVSIYKEYLGVPNGHMSHKLLHTSYVKRGNNNEYSGENYRLEIPKQPKKQPAFGVKKAMAEDDMRSADSHHRVEVESIRILDLESENKRLKNELADIKETVDILKRVIDDYAHR